MGRFQVPKPVEIGDRVKVRIESENGQGEGIGRVEDFIVFTKGAKTDEFCLVKIKDVKRTFAIGEKLQIIKE